MAGDKVRQNLFGSPSGNARGKSPSRQINATASAAAPLASPAPRKADEATLSTTSNDGASLSSSMQNTNIVQLSKLPASPIRPVAAASPARRGGADEGRPVWRSAAATGPPPDLRWSPTLERLIMNSTKQIEAIEQVGQQAVTVVLRAMPPLRQLSRGAAQQRDRYAVSVRLAMRRGAISALMDASGALLADMQHLFGLLSAQHSGSGQHGRTHARRIESLTKDLEGAREQFTVICKEMKLAGRFMLMRDPTAGTSPAQEERIAEDGQKDTRQLESVLRAVTNSRNKMGAVWGTLAALQSARVTPEDASWPLLRGLDISTAADVLSTLQLDSKPAAPGAAAAAARGETETEGNPSPLASPGLGRAWWKAPSMGRSPRKSPLKGGPAGNPTSPLKTPSKSAPAGALAAAAAAAAARSPANGGLANGGLASGGLANRVAPHGLANGGSCEAGTPARAPQENGVEPSAQEQSVDIPAIQIRSLKNGEVYRGGIVKGAKTGFGQFEYGNGDVYDGQFDAGCMHGYGVYTFATGGLFQGQWNAGKYAGLGVESFPAGGTYHGEYAEGCRSGWGACSFSNGDYFEGQWAAGARHGRGMQQCPDHSSFVGSYREGKRHGHGCYTFGSGDRYMGEYAEDVPHGAGVYLFANGQVYEGQWRAGRKHGWCVYSLANGQQWAGRWADGRPVWMQAMAAAKAEGGDQADDVAEALAAAKAARSAGNEGAAHFKEHWQPEGPLQASVRQAVQSAVAAAETATAVQEGVLAAVTTAVAAAEAVAAARRKGR